MRLALWTPAPVAGWLAPLAAGLERSFELCLVHAEPAVAPDAALDLYHLAGSPAFGFVYRALLRRPGIVLLEEGSLHALVHAETAGRGDDDAYRREARFCHGETGGFVARQVLAGIGGALPARLAMSQRVSDQSLALVTLDAEGRARAAELVPDLAALVAQVVPRAEPARRAIAARADAQASHLGAALVELDWTARELGLAAAPADARALVAGLFGGEA